MALAIAICLFREGMSLNRFQESYPNYIIFAVFRLTGLSIFLVELLADFSYYRNLVIVGAGFLLLIGSFSHISDFMYILVLGHVEDDYNHLLVPPSTLRRMGSYKVDVALHYLSNPLIKSY